MLPYLIIGGHTMNKLKSLLSEIDSTQITAFVAKWYLEVYFLKKCHNSNVKKPTLYCGQNAIPLGILIRKKIEFTLSKDANEEA